MTAPDWLERKRFVVFDFEAVTPAGASPIPIEVAAIVMTAGNDWTTSVLVNELIALEDPALLTPFDTQQTGITAEMLLRARSSAAVFSSFAGALPHDGVLVAHNAAFERNVLVGSDAPDALTTALLLDTLKLSRAIFRRQSHALDVLARQYDLHVPAHRHRALADVELTCGVLRALLSDADVLRGIDSWYRLVAVMGLPPRPMKSSPPHVGQQAIITRQRSRGNPATGG